MNGKEGLGLVPLSEMARRLGITRERVRQLVHEGRLRGVRLGRYWYVVEEGGFRLGLAFTLFTHAGGAGKTSLARDLGYELALRGFKVLLVDVDPQANLTSWLGVRDVDQGETLLSLLDTGHLPEPRYLEKLDLYLIPSSLDLARMEVRLAQRPLSTLLLRSALKRRREYDFVLIDSLPSLGHLAAMAALAGHGLLVPVETGLKGLEALVGVMEVAKEYRQALGQVETDLPDPFIRLFIPTKFDPRTSGDQKVLDRIMALREIAPVASPLAYRPGPHRRATEAGMPIHFGRDKQAREEIERLAEEFLAMAQGMGVVDDSLGYGQEASPEGARVDGGRTR
ncbi:MAG: AAA family ATPase [Thermus sp.]|uniref:AAA family ATPase n=1 Tax=Thermus sp. TaxID=275 RepID=UPI00391D1D06